MCSEGLVWAGAGVCWIAGLGWAAHCSAGSALSLALIAPIPSPVGAETDGDLGINKGAQGPPLRDSVPGIPPVLGLLVPEEQVSRPPGPFRGPTPDGSADLSGGPLGVTGWHRPCGRGSPSGTLLTRDQSAGTAFTRGLPRSRDPQRAPRTCSSASPTPTCGTLEPAPCRAFNFYPTAQGFFRLLLIVTFGGGEGRIPAAQHVPWGCPPAPGGKTGPDGSRRHLGAWWLGLDSV